MPVFSPVFCKALHYNTLATTTTIEPYTMNPRRLGYRSQSLYGTGVKRPHARTKWENLFMCGESAVTGAGDNQVHLAQKGKFRAVNLAAEMLHSYARAE